MSLSSLLDEKQISSALVMLVLSARYTRDRKKYEKESEVREKKIRTNEN